MKHLLLLFLFLSLMNVWWFFLSSLQWLSLWSKFWESGTIM